METKRTTQPPPETDHRCTCHPWKTTRRRRKTSNNLPLARNHHRTRMYTWIQNMAPKITLNRVGELEKTCCRAIRSTLGFLRSGLLVSCSEPASWASLHLRTSYGTDTTLQLQIAAQTASKLDSPTPNSRTNGLFFFFCLHHHASRTLNWAEIGGWLLPTLRIGCSTLF